MSRSIPLLFLLAALSLASLVTPAFSGELGIYRGQYASEPTLKSICESVDYKFQYVSIGYLYKFGNTLVPELSPGTNYPGIDKDIETCQTLGVKVLLSIGGNTGSYSLSSSADAKNVADYLWNNFLDGKSDSRPFGTAILDGIDFNILLGPTENYDLLALYLAEYGVFLSAATQCSYPDRYLGKALVAGLFNTVWVRFFDDSSCAYEPEDISTIINPWNTWTSEVNAKEVFLGVTAHPPEIGYIPPKDLISNILPVITNTTKYGGVMMSRGSPQEKILYVKAIKGSV